MDERDLPSGLLPILAFLSFFAVVLVPFWLVTLALAPLPVYLTTKQRGPVVGAVMLVVVGAAAAVVISWAAIPAVLILLALGYLPGLTRFTDRPGRRIIITAVFLFASFSGVSALAYLADGAQTARMLAQESATLRQQVLSQVGGQANVPGLEAELDKLIAVIPYILLGMVALTSIWLAWLNYFATGRLAGRWGFNWTPLPAFSRWQMPWFLAYGFIFGLIGVLFNKHFGAYWLQAFGAGVGFLLVFGALYFVQGLAIIKYFADKHGFGPAAKAGAIVVGILVQVIFQGVSWLGLFDTWFDFRRLASSG